MSTLTNKEKDALEDVFLSISTKGNKYKKIDNLLSIIIASEISTIVSKVLKRAKIGLKKKKTLNFLSHLSKKKKYLSK